jgi:hypothetical protein
MESREEIREARRRLKERYRGLYDELLDIFFRHDPMQLGYETNRDEYDPEVMAILPRLERSATVSEVERIIREEFIRLFTSEDDNNDIDALRLDAVAAEVWRTYQAYLHRPGWSTARSEDGSAATDCP